MQVTKNSYFLVVIEVRKRPWIKMVANQVSRVYGMATTGNRVFKAQIVRNGPRTINAMSNRPQSPMVIDFMISPFYITKGLWNMHAAFSKVANQRCMLSLLPNYPPDSMSFLEWSQTGGRRPAISTSPLVD